MARPKVLNNLADIKSARGVVLRVRTQRRTRRAVVIFGYPITVAHSPKLRLVVMMTLAPS
jgi:hypothetical protein